MPSKSMWKFQAIRSVKEMLGPYDSTYGLGSMSGSIYDTAWVAMVARIVDGKTQYLFPECFDTIYSYQREDGGWAQYGHPFDRIINSLAALLALSVHRKTVPCTDEIDKKIEQGRNFLAGALDNWNVQVTEYVGFELIIPALLEYLAQESVIFEFPGKSALFALREHKLSMVPTDYIYTKPTAFLHSLEALVGKVDFDRVQPHLVHGSLMGSPAATAAYLMNISAWDAEAESYLRHVVQTYRQGKHAAVPAAFPTTIFELAWVVCALLENGFGDLELVSALADAKDILYKTVITGDGLVGFAPGMPSDADDTAKTITALNLLGIPLSADALVQKYEGKSHFHTYEFERNPSMTVNCNILLALLHSPDPAAYSTQIEKILKRLIENWWTKGEVSDKWHLSKEYTLMLLSQATVKAIYQWSLGSLPALDGLLRQQKIWIMLLEVLIRFLHAQSEDGSIGDRHFREETSYAVIALANLASLPLVARSPLNSAVVGAIERARSFLQIAGGDENEYIWVEKLTYASRNLCAAYVLAALNTPVPSHAVDRVPDGVYSIPYAKVREFTKLYSQTPLFSNVARWKIEASLIEGYLFLPELVRMKYDVFDREGCREDKYLEYIPFTWIGPSNLGGTFAAPELLLDLMVLAMQNYQVDEFIEATIGVGHQDDAIEFVRSIFESPEFVDSFLGTEINGTASNGTATYNGTESSTTSTSMTSNAAVSNGTIYKGNDTSEEFSNGHSASSSYSHHDASQRLKKFVQWVLRHPRIQNAHARNKEYLLHELKAYLLAQLGQLHDNARLQAQSSRRLFRTPRLAYSKWARGPAAENVSCHYAFALFLCLLSDRMSGEDCFLSEKARYVAEDYCFHLATLCRMYNDYGSIARDRDEGNLNSVNFPEFAPDRCDDRELKDRLMWLAGYERECLERAWTKLEGLCGEPRKRLLQILKMYGNTVDLYGQLYILRDLTCRV